MVLLWSQMLDTPDTNHLVRFLCDTPTLLEAMQRMCQILISNQILEFS